MATVRPFRGVTYDAARVPDMAAVTCPPYDVISDADRSRLYERNPYNVVRIVSGREEPTDTADENKYTRACAFFTSWMWEGMLHEDPLDALYVYRQAFHDPTGHRRRVWGLLASVSLDDPVLAHEKTMPGPKADRLALMQAVPANVSPIYALYRQDGGGISSGLAPWSSGSPVADFVDDEGTRHEVWAVHDTAFHGKVAAALDRCPLLIADGHHRFETAKAYRDLRRAADGSGPWDATLALLVDAGAQPVLIKPYHRIVRRVTVPDVPAVLRERFAVDDLGTASPDTVTSLADSLWEPSAEPRFGLLHEGRAYRLVTADPAPGTVPAGVLAERALEPLGVGSAQDDLTFTPDAHIVADAVATERAACGFLLPPVGVDSVWDLAASGAKMPEKSTYFHPKPRDGIVIRPLEPC